MFTIVIQIYNSVKSTWFHWGKRKFAISESNLLPFFSLFKTRNSMYIHFSFAKKKQSNEFHSSAFFVLSVSSPEFSRHVLKWTFFQFRSIFVSLYPWDWVYSSNWHMNVFVQIYFLYNFFLFPLEKVSNSENTGISISLTLACNELFRKNSLWWFGVKAFLDNVKNWIQG